MVKVSNLKFEYKKNEVILNDINFELEQGKIYVLLGKNGAGKTTLLKCLSGIYGLNGGKIEQDVEPILIEDNPKLYFFLTGLEYIELILNLNEGKNQNVVDTLVKELDMEKHLDKNIIDYSLGMKHKMALITAIMLNYNLFLIDEPLTALDPETSRFMINYFKKMKEVDKALLISTHMMHVAYQLADEIFILSNGKLRKIINDFTHFEEFENYIIEQLNVTL